MEKIGYLLPWFLKYYKYVLENAVLDESEIDALRHVPIRILHLEQRNQDTLFLLQEMEDICAGSNQETELIKVLISQCGQLEELNRLGEIEEIGQRAISLGNISRNFLLVGKAAMHVSMSIFNQDADSLNDLTNSRATLAIDYANIALENFLNCGESSAFADSAWVISRNLEGLQDFQGALEYIEKGIQNYEETRGTSEFRLSRKIEYDLQRGRLLRLLGRLEEAEACLEKILSLPEVQDKLKIATNGGLIFMLLPLTQLALGWTQFDLSKYESAWESFSHAAFDFYNVDTFQLMRADFGRAQTLYRVGGFQESLEICRNILARRSNIYPLDPESVEKNRSIGVLRSFALSHLVRLNNYDGLGYGRFKVLPSQEIELDWSTRLLMALNMTSLESHQEALDVVGELESAFDFMPSQEQADKLSMIKAHILIKLNRVDEARSTLIEIEEFSSGNRKHAISKALNSLETLERYDLKKDRESGSKILSMTDTDIWKP